MNNIWPQKIEEILSVGKSLSNAGVNNWALTKVEAIEAIEKLCDLQISILGGDVYELSDKVLQPNYDNWYCELLPDEEQKFFIKRSAATAKQYIEAYQINDPDKTFFILVPDF